MFTDRRFVTSTEIDGLAQIVWDYHQMHHALHAADIILVQGSHDLRVAERGAALFLDGYAPRIVFSGGLGNLTREVWDEPEAEKFATVAREMGVPETAMLLESQSTNTGENVQLTRRLLERENLDPDRFILVQKPYMERRTYATFRKVWPEKDAVVTSPSWISTTTRPAKSRKRKSLRSWLGICNGFETTRLAAFRSSSTSPPRCGTPSSVSWLSALRII